MAGVIVVAGVVLIARWALRVARPVTPHEAFRRQRVALARAVAASNQPEENR